MDWDDFLKTFVCLLLICCLLVNVSPLRANAVGLELAAAAGIVATALLGAAGVAFHPETAADVNALGESMRTYLYQWGTSAEKLDEVEEFFGSLTLMNFDPDDDPDDDTPHQTQVKLARGILSGIVLWIASLALDGTTTKDKVFDSSKISSFNLPTWDISTFPYFFITLRSPPGGSAYMTLYVCDAPLTYLGKDSSNRYYSPRPLSEYPRWSYRYWFSTGFSYNWKITEDKVFRGTNTDSLSSSMWMDGYGAYFTDDYAPKIYYSNFDIYDLSGNVHFKGDETTVLYVDVPFLPDSLFGDAAGLADGSTRPEDLLVPDVLDLGGVISSNSSAVDDVIDLQDKLVSGDITYDEYLGMVLAESPTFSLDLDTDTVTYNVGDVATPLQIAAFVNDGGTLTYQWYQWVSGELVHPSIPDAVTDTFIPPTDEAGVYHYYCTVTNTTSKGTTSFATSKTATVEVLDPSLSDKLSDLNSGTFFNRLTDAIVTPLLNGIKAIFVPSSDYLTAKVDAIRSEFGFGSSIIETAEYIGGALEDIDIEPPVIYIDLSAAQWGYYLGEKVVFVDMSWYESYKPVGDALISSFLWIVFVWKMFVKLPGIVSGMPGDFVMDGVHSLGMNNMLPVRNAAYEVQRQTNRSLFRRRRGS